MLCCISHFKPTQLLHLHDASFEKYLGEGTFGKVKIYRCKEKDCNGTLCEQCFVIKTLKLCNNTQKFFSFFCPTKRKYIKTIDKKLKHILLNEWDIGKNLNHPNIIKTLDIDLPKRSLILEYYESIDLFIYFTHNIFEFPLKTKNEITIQIFRQILNGVKYLHEFGIVHMDLKLENIIINPESKLIKIIDFGKATKINPNENLKLILDCEWGTTQYLPPECFENSSSFIDLKKIDSWACGIILYNVLYNSSPWYIACINKDPRYHRFIKHLQQYDSLDKYIFPGLNYYLWNSSQITIINNLFKSFLIENFKDRISIPNAMEILDEIKF